MVMALAWLGSTFTISDGGCILTPGCTAVAVDSVPCGVACSVAAMFAG